MTPDSRPAAVFDRAAATYDRVGVDFFTVFGRRLVGEAGVRPGERVLDVGCGGGAVLLPAAQAVGPRGRAIGIDLAPGMVERTAAELEAAGLRHADVRLADAASPPTDLGQFDAVLSSLVLFFLDDPADALGRWAALLSPRGRIGLTTFVADDDDDLLRPVLERFVQAPAGTPAADRPTPFELVRDTAWLDAALRSVGLSPREAATLRHAAVFDDIDHFWRWAMSHGMRVALEAVPPERRGDLRSALDEVLPLAPDRRRRLLHVTVRFTVADQSPR